MDEAHRMSASDPEHKTERYRLGELLSRRTHHLLLLTGTPHKGDEALVTFPDPETGKVRRPFTNREVRTVRFELDSQEFAFYEALTRYVQDQSICAADSSARGPSGSPLYQRRFASSLHAVRRSLERRLEKPEDRLRRPRPEPMRRKSKRPLCPPNPRPSVRRSRRCGRCCNRPGP
ncbi:MAG: hypothetical protein KatS3mg131_0288 [Candidatus Tectimicrobiota bacterium]|nr:MAG: hypothetical protein KatS3mg131_0288 [Candidatus Tectomicrobia bacterium]